MFLSICPFFALLTPLPEIAFITEEILGCTNKTFKGANTARENPPPCILSFIVSLTLLINTPKLLAILCF